MLTWWHCSVFNYHRYCLYAVNTEIAAHQTCMTRYMCVMITEAALCHILALLYRLLDNYDDCRLLVFSHSIWQAGSFMLTLISSSSCFSFLPTLRNLPWLAIRFWYDGHDAIVLVLTVSKNLSLQLLISRAWNQQEGILVKCSDMLILCAVKSFSLLKNSPNSELKASFI